MRGERNLVEECRTRDGVAGITGPEELETLQEEPEEGAVLVRQADDATFEGNYEGGLPHGYFRHINMYGDLEFFGCFYRGSLLGERRLFISFKQKSVQPWIRICSLSTRL